MRLKDSLSLDSLRNSSESKSLFYTVIFTPFFLGFFHHIDHIVRGNHVGWPLVPEVTPFTYSLAVYPLGFLGLYLTFFTEMDETKYWLGFFGFTSILVTYTHTFIEPPADIISPHASPVLGYLALLLAGALSASLIFGLIYIFRRWKSQD